MSVSPQFNGRAIPLVMVLIGSIGASLAGAWFSTQPTSGLAWRDALFSSPTRPELPSFPLAWNDPSPEILPELLAGLSSNEAVRRSNAIAGIGRMGSAAREHAATLVPLLDDANGGVRSQAARALCLVDRESPETAARVARHLDDYDKQVRNVVGMALSGMGAGAVPAVVPLLDHPQDEVRWRAARILQQIGVRSADAASALRKATRDSSSGVRDAATLALLFSGHATLPEAIGWLHAENPHISAAALAQICRFGPGAAEAVPALVDCLEAPRREELPQLLATLRSLKHSASPAVPALLSLLDSPVDYDFAMIYETLAEIGAPDDRLTPRLMKSLGGGNPATAAAAGRLLALIDPDLAQDRAQELVSRLDSSNWNSLAATLAALGGLGPQAAVAVPELIPLLRSDSELLQDQTIAVLARIGPGASPAADELVALLQLRLVSWRERDVLARQLISLTDAIGAVGPAAGSAGPLLMELIESRHPPLQRTSAATFADRARSAALVAAARVGFRSASYREQIAMALVDETSTIRGAALRSLAVIAEHSPASQAQIVAALGDPDALIRFLAADVSLSAAGAVPEVVSGLSGLLFDTDRDVRFAAAGALGRAGPAASGALPALFDALAVEENFAPPGELSRSRVVRVRGARADEGPDSSVALTIARAIERIEGDRSARASHGGSADAGELPAVDGK